MSRKQAGHTEDRKKWVFLGFPSNVYERDCEELGHYCREKKKLDLCLLTAYDGFSRRIQLEHTYNLLNNT